MRYIDAEKLIAEIDRQEIGCNTDGKHTAEYNTCRKILDIITSLQQEQLEVELDKLGAIARHLIAIKDHIEDARLDDAELEVLRKIGYPERYGIQATPKIKGWVARGRDDELSFFTEKPRRLTCCWIGNGFCDAMILMENFPDLKFEDDPIEVELIIKRV